MALAMYSAWEQAADPDGDILWVSGPLPGAVHDLNAARIWGILRELAASGLVVLADKGYQALATTSAQLETWRILRKLRCCL